MRITTQMEQRLRQIAYDGVNEALQSVHGYCAARFALFSAPSYGQVQRVDGGFFVDLPVFVSDEAVKTDANLSAVSQDILEAVAVSGK